MNSNGKEIGGYHIRVDSAKEPEVIIIILNIVLIREIILLRYLLEICHLEQKKRKLEIILVNVETLIMFELLEMKILKVFNE